jgi:hypothetical protein
VLADDKNIEKNKTAGEPGNNYALVPALGRNVVPDDESDQRPSTPKTLRRPLPPLGTEARVQNSMAAEVEDGVHFDSHLPQTRFLIPILALRRCRYWAHAS